jgi:hypothetical protein
VFFVFRYLKVLNDPRQYLTIIWNLLQKIPSIDGILITYWVPLRILLGLSHRAQVKIEADAQNKLFDEASQKLKDIKILGAKDQEEFAEELSK